MPRRVDAEQRRREVAAALFAVVDAEGLQAASLPRIARELGATTGLVQQYFRTKDELLAFALDELGQAVRRRVEQAVLATGANDMETRLAAALAVLGGADDEHRAEGRIWLAFLARAAVEPSLRQIHLAGAEEIRRLCTSALVEAQRLGELPMNRDPAAEALGLAVFADGLALTHAIEPELVTPSEVRSQLRRYLARLFRSEES